MSAIKKNLQQINKKIALLAKKYRRNPQDIKLIAVSKTRSLDDIQEAIINGQLCFGENYVQESIKKINYFNNLSLEWHFIGSLQSNKTSLVATSFDWCHTVSNFKIAQRLNNQRPANLAPLNILIQINISGESSKSGLHLEDLASFTKSISNLPYLKLRGLMTIPAKENNYANQLSTYLKVSEIFNNMKLQYPIFDTLSLGMSHDMEAAIAANSTMLRIGTAIFGMRSPVTRKNN